MGNLQWKKDYGDGYETDDRVLWVKGKPTDTCVCRVSGGCYYAYLDGIEIGVYDTCKDAKAAIMEELK